MNPSLSPETNNHRTEANPDLPLESVGIAPSTAVASAKPAVIRIALAGNPNSGKSSLFNKLIGGNQHVGNYPGVTVEKYQGCIRYHGSVLEFTDLPGIYSLTSYSQEEIVARRFLIHDRPDVIVNVIDASNLERNLYLTVQLLEMGLNLVVVLNMMDEVRKKGMVFDTDMLSRRLGCPVVETVASHGEGIHRLKQVVVEACGNTDLPRVNYTGVLGEEVARLVPLIQGKTPYPPGFAAVKLLEDDREVAEEMHSDPLFARLCDEVAVSMQRIEKESGTGSAIVLGDKRYGFASGLVREITIRDKEETVRNMTETIDTIVTHRLLSLPFFALTMYLTFWITFTLGTPPMEWIDSGLALVSQFVLNALPDTWLRSLLVDGIIAGVGGVIVFLPNIVLLFMCIAFLEDTGYMARIAFIMDRVMHHMGLHGRSFIPLMIGFGCTVPAIMATRTIRDRRGRLTTMMILPLMSCGARLPIYLMIIPAFFPKNWHAPILWSIYLLGVALAFFVAIFLRKTLFRGENEPFVMELPPYRMPTVNMVLRHMWDRSWMYLRKAGTIILGFSILLWFLLNFPQKKTYDVDTLVAQGTHPDLRLQARVLSLINAGQPAASQSAVASDEPSRNLTDGQIENIRRLEQLNHSITGRIGHVIEPLVRPMGFDWKIGTAFLGAFAAKELFVSQMGIILALGNNDIDAITSADSTPSGTLLRIILQRNYPNPLIGICIILFALIATPCMATVAITAREAGHWIWGVLQWSGLTVLGWLVTTIVYQIGTFIQSL
ncbi:ferrous iron transport protein B [bacterium]|nr:ferrous iron transport protein B [candidate division CSSED10-310 bacterium]